MTEDADTPHEAWIDILVSRDHRKVSEFALVLESRSIPYAAMQGRREYRLAVRTDDVEAALEELAEYERENARPTGGQRKIEYLGYGARGVFVYVAVLLIVAFLSGQDAWGWNWRAAGRSDAGAIMDGEWWRAVTALSLHADFVHLVGNIGFGSFFGYFVARYLGAGVGWLAILGSGVLGNWINALVQSPDHLAIGASTAVFGALGILSAYTWRRGFLAATPWRVRFAPITAGIALLAFTGTGGENTDLLAHLFGFVAGFGTGAALAGVELPSDERSQRLYGSMAAGIFGVAWIFALWARA